MLKNHTIYRRNCQRWNYRQFKENTFSLCMIAYYWDMNNYNNVSLQKSHTSLWNHSSKWRLGDTLDGMSDHRTLSCATCVSAYMHVFGLLEGSNAMYCDHANYTHTTIHTACLGWKTLDILYTLKETDIRLYKPTVHVTHGVFTWTFNICAKKNRRGILKNIFRLFVEYKDIDP